MAANPGAGGLCRAHWQRALRRIGVVLQTGEPASDGQVVQAAAKCRLSLSSHPLESTPWMLHNQSIRLCIAWYSSLATAMP
jgi:hypothetical protein